MRKFYTLIFIFAFYNVQAQVTVSGTVYDISKQNMVEYVRVVSTGGMFTFTDSLGRYSILVNTQDSLTFIYNNKPTQKFPVVLISTPHQFDLSLNLPVESRYKLLKEVTVFSKSHKQDSIENRETYADIFEYKRPGISTSMSNGVAGADLNELINIFRFRRNRNLKAFQQRLEIQEQEKFISYRFNKLFVKRITGLTEPAVDTFLVWYRPDYEFTRTSNELEFNQYILDASYHFRKMSKLPGRKPDEN